MVLEIVVIIMGCFLGLSLWCIWFLTDAVKQLQDIKLKELDAIIKVSKQIGKRESEKLHKGEPK